MDLLRNTVTAALLAGLYATDISGQQTYSESIRAKQRSRCAGEFMIKTGGAYKISEIAGKAHNVINEVEQNRSMSDQQRTDRLMTIKDDIRKELGAEYAQYTDCVTNYAVVNPIGSSLYQKTGRVEPPLTGTFEEQVRTLVRELRWQSDYFADMTAAAERQKANDAVHVVRSVQAISNIISGLPDLISADININNEGASGTIRPKFMGYGDDSVITFHDAKGPPQNSRLEIKSDDYELYSVGNPTNSFVLLGKNWFGETVSYNSFSRDGLLKYMEFLKAGTLGRKISDRSTPWAFAEFSKFLNRLGNKFDGTAKFRTGRNRRAYGDRYIDFQFYGFRGHNTVGQKDIGVAIYFDDTEAGWRTDNDYVDNFRDNFREFAVGGSRSEIHMFSKVGSHTGTHPTGVIEMPALINANLFLILEEK